MQDTKELFESMELIKVAQLSVILLLNPLSNACGKGLAASVSAAAPLLVVVASVVRVEVGFVTVEVTVPAEDVFFELVDDPSSSLPSCLLRRSSTVASVQSRAPFGGGGDRSTRIGPDRARRSSAVAGSSASGTGGGASPCGGVSTICSGM